MINLLAISGSLRSLSSNTTLLQAAALLAPKETSVTLFDSIGNLPHFNPDLQGKEPQVVLDFRKQITDAHGLIISTPEYAHGLPGSLKNAFDWLVDCTGFINKPIILLNASGRGAYAQASLVETLSVMTAKIIAEASATVSLWGKNLDAPGIASNSEMASILNNSLTTFVKTINAGTIF